MTRDVPHQPDADHRRVPGLALPAPPVRPGEPAAVAVRLRPHRLADQFGDRPCRRSSSSPCGGSRPTSWWCSSPGCWPSRATTTRRPSSTAPTPLRRFWHITLPQLSPIIFFVIVVSALLCARIFLMPYIITGGGPGNATRVLSMLVYETGFSYLKMGRAAAISVVLFAIALVFTVRGRCASSRAASRSRDEPRQRTAYRRLTAHSGAGSGCCRCSRSPFLSLADPVDDDHVVPGRREDVPAHDGVDSVGLASRELFERARRTRLSRSTSSTAASSRSP